MKKPAQLQNKSPRKLQRTSKISLALVLLASGAFGALVGEKSMEKLGGNGLNGFFESKNHMAKNSKYAILTS